MGKNARSIVFIVFLLLAGCLQNETRLSANGTSPLVAHGYGYDGNLTASEGRISINVVDESNTGRVEAQWDDEGAWSLDWSNFTEAPDKPYQGGGIVFGLDAHGDSGNGDANLPNVHYVSAGWGVGHVQKNGQDFIDPLTSQPDFRLHYMALASGIRDPVSRKVLKGDGTTPYDPATPSDGVTHAGNPEVLLLIQSTMPGTPPRDVVEKNISDTVNQPEYQKAFKLVVPEGATKILITVNLTSTTPGPAIVGQVTFRLINPEGDSLAADTLGGVGQKKSITLNPGSRVAPGEHTIEASGRGTNLAYSGFAVISVASKPAFVRLLSFEGAEISATGPNAE